MAADRLRLANLSSIYSLTQAESAEAGGKTEGRQGHGSPEHRGAHLQGAAAGWGSAGLVKGEQRPKSWDRGREH